MRSTESRFLLSPFPFALVVVASPRFISARACVDRRQKELHTVRLSQSPLKHFYVHKHCEIESTFKLPANLISIYSDTNLTYNGHFEQLHKRLRSHNWVTSLRKITIILQHFAVILARMFFKFCACHSN